MKNILEVAATHLRPGSGGKGKNSTNDEDPAVMKPGDEIVSGDSLRHQGNAVKLTDDGSLIVTTKDGNVLWHSLSMDWGCKSLTDMACKTLNKPYKLKYQKNGDLTIKDNSGKMLWHSVTDISTCGGKEPGKVEFKDGQLAVYSSDLTLQWSSGTSGGKGIKGVPKRATRKVFGDGVNACITKSNCLTIYADYKMAGVKKSMGPGEYVGMAWNVMF